jgi:predicted nuclease of predicted toxin-antitoxin system
MADIQLLADMNISPQTVTFLQQQGWDIIRVSEVLPATASDSEILEFARREERVIVTQDLDFSTLLALSGYNQPSLITLRLLASDPDTVNQKLIEVLPTIKQELEEGCAVTIEDTAVRIRRLPIR